MLFKTSAVILGPSGNLKQVMVPPWIKYEWCIIYIFVMINIL